MLDTKTFKTISALIPTRGRIARLETLLESYVLTTLGTAGLSDLVFRVDDDDAETRAFLDAWAHRHPSVTLACVVGPRYDGYRSMPTFFNELAAASSGDVLLCGNDDMIFRSHDWAGEILAAANTFPDGIFNLGVSTHNPTHYPFSIVSRRVVEQLGFLWDPRIFWGDIYLRDLMSWFGRTKMIPHVQIDHDWAGYRPDRVFAETRHSKSVIEGSPTYWKAVHAPAVAEAASKLQRLLSC